MECRSAHGMTRWIGLRARPPFRRGPSPARHRLGQAGRGWA